MTKSIYGIITIIVILGRICFKCNGFASSDVKVKRHASSYNANSTNEWSTLSDSIVGNQCVRIPATDSLCPKGFIYIYNHGQELCYVLKANQTFPPVCPYPHNLPYLQIRSFLNYEFRSYKIWLNAFKNTTAKSQQLEWIENGDYYGTPVYTVSNKHETPKECLIAFNFNFIRVPCYDKYHALCMYSFEDLQFSELPARCEALGYEKCIVSTYNLSEPMCFCRKINQTRPLKYEFCKKLAEPVYYFQSKLLTQYYEYDSKLCWIGFYKEESTAGTLKWHSTKDEVNYTFWTPYIDCTYSEGAFHFRVPPYHGWMMSKDGNLDCSICEVELNFKKPILTLIYNTNDNQIELIVDNFDSISTFYETDIYCFSDSNSDDFKQSVSYETISESLNSKTLKLLGITSYPSYYWCDAFEYTSNEVIKSNLIVAFNELEGYGNAFVILTDVEVEINEDPFMDKIHATVCSDIYDYLKTSYENVLSTRPITGNFESKTRVNINCHLTTKESKEKEEEYSILYDLLKNYSSSNEDIDLVSFSFSEVCIAESTFTSEGIKLDWPDTVVGASAIPTNRLCLDSENSMTPVTRKCDGEFIYGAKWADPIGTCYNDTQYSETTHKLFDLAYGNSSVEHIVEDLLEITQEVDNNDPIDVHLISSVLDRVTEKVGERIDKMDFSTVINNIMYYNNDTLKSAQIMLNSTDRILSQLDNYMNTEHSWHFVLPKIILHVTNLDKTNETGLAVYKIKEGDEFKFYKTAVLYQNTSFDDVLKDPELDTAVLFPSDEIDEIKRQLAKTQDVRLVILIFYNDFLFNEVTEKDQQSKTKIVSVTMPGYSGLLKSPIKVAFRTPHSYKNKKACSHWNYGLSSVKMSISGSWETNQDSDNHKDFVEICEFNHMTHFGLLIQGELELNGNEQAMKIITAIGSALSLIGIIPIFLTAALFKTWRSRSGNIILLNFCIAIVLQIIVIFCLYAVTEDGVLCKILGVGIHYSVLSEFCWMFVVAVLQHRRFVMVFSGQEKFIVTKCLLVGWGAPLIPIIIVLAISVDSYSYNNKNQICNLSGIYLLYAYTVPIVSILISNFVIFTLIIYSVSRQKATCAQKHRNYKLQILLALFLFFVLGMTWIFGFLGALVGGVWLTYLFCITATLRGLVLFLFFIVGHEETLLMWKKKSIYYLGNSDGKSKSTTNDTVLSNSD